MDTDPRFRGSEQDRKELALEVLGMNRAGVPKSTIEAEYLGTVRAHGKVFTAFIRQTLGIETEKRHPMSIKNEELTSENRRLQGMLTDLGFDPKGPAAVAYTESTHATGVGT